MNVSSIIVRVSPEGLEEAVRRVGELPGVEVHVTDSARGCIVVAQETGTTDEQDAGFRRIQGLPGLLSADLDCHYFGEDDGDTP